MFPTVTVIVPALNEAENLIHVLPRIPSWVDEVILVDDGSTDATVEAARNALPSIKIVANRRRRGKGNALRAGYEAADGEIVVQIDADGSADAAAIPGFVAALCSGADYAKGSRFMGGTGSVDMVLHRKLGNVCLARLANLLFRLRFTDLCCGCNAIWADLVPGLGLTAEGFEIESMLNLRASRHGLRIVEVPSFERRRINGKSHLRAIPDGLRILATILRERLRKAKEPELGHLVQIPSG